jgi:hypothetical protein
MPSAAPISLASSKLSAGDPDPSDVHALPAASAKPRRGPVVELLWFDEAGTAKLRQRWPKLCSELEFAPHDPQHDLADDDPERARAHHTHFGLMIESAAVELDELPSLLREAVDHRGRFTPPIALVEGRLQLPFDENEELRALIESVRPLSIDDKKMQPLLEQAETLLASPWAAGSRDAVSNMGRRVRKMYMQGRRAVSIEQLDGSLERLLLSTRAYQKRRLLGGEWIRAELLGAQPQELVVTYLPVALSDTLPMLQSFVVRLIVEVQARQDQYEPNDVALKTMTIGRVLPF